MQPVIQRCLVVLVVLVAIGATTNIASAQPGLDSNDFNDSSDKTRVFGILYDSSGEILTKADIRIFNDRAPANEVRARGRKSGGYLARGLGRLYTERDLEGIWVRARFEKEGFRPSEIVSFVPKNNGVEINPILWKTEEDPSTMTAWSALLSGKVTNAKGKKMKTGTVTVTTPTDPDFAVEAPIEKNGEFRVLLWQAPADLFLTATSGGASKRVPIRFEGKPRTDVVAQVNQVIELDS